MTEEFLNLLKPVKILFIQLPLTDHSYSYITGNIEYAPAVISAYLKKHIKAHVEIQYLPEMLSSQASDTLLSKYIINLNPQIISFTNYLWNTERNLNIAKIIKSKISDVKIFMGGPEINPASWVLSEKREGVNYFVSGEGEWFFGKYLAGDNLENYIRVKDGNRIIIQPLDELLKTDKIVEPLTNRYLDIREDGSTYMELTRGCPYRCSYCFYSKNYKTIRELPFELLLDAVTGKTGLYINEIYLMAPTFNASPRFKDYLDLLIKHNMGISLHTEMRSQGINMEIAGLMYKAGFRSVETGLQTMNKTALNNIGRDSDVSKEIEGMLHLKEAGIDLKIGIIPGLPGDSPDEFIKTVDKMTGLGFKEDIELYPLMILPGTGIRDRADIDSVTYQERPPYYLIDGWNFDYKALSDISLYVENITGYTHTYKRLPDFSKKSMGSFIKGVYFNGENRDNWRGSNYVNLIDSNPFTFFITFTETSLLKDGLDLLLNNINKSNQLYNIVLFCNRIIDEKCITVFLQNYNCNSLHSRLNIFTHRNWGLNIYMYHVTDDIDLYMKSEDKYSIIEAVFKITEKNYDVLLKNNSLIVNNILVGINTYEHVKSYLKDKFIDSLENVSFESEEDQKSYYELLGQEYIDIPSPYRYKIMSF